MVDNTIIIDILKTRREKLAAITGRINFPKLLAAAKEKWVSYEPNAEECATVGIDGSWNKRPYQGIDLCLSDAVAVDSANKKMPVGRDGSGLLWYHNLGIVRNETLASKMLGLESDIAMETLDSSAVDADLILVDGSITAWLSSDVFKHTYEKHDNGNNGNGDGKKKKRRIEAFLETVKENSSIDGREKNVLLFISKSSETRNQLKENDGVEGDDLLQAGDMFYFNRIKNNNASGFSKPFPLKDMDCLKGLKDSIVDGNDLSVIEVYARLRRDTPMLKIEFIVDHQQEHRILNDDSIIRQLLNKLVFHSVAGYPYCLKLAHKNCIITDLDIERISHIYHLNTETGAREPLHEVIANAMEKSGAFQKDTIRAIPIDAPQEELGRFRRMGGAGEGGLRK